MLIDEHKPLPSHTKLDSWECYAKIVLEDLLSDEFSNLILADKPDLQDINGVVGIEVTRAENPAQIEAESLYSGLRDKNEDQRQHDIERIEQLGAKVYGGFMMGIGGPVSFDRVNTAIAKKCEKLSKGGYQHFNEYHLFLFSSVFAVDFMLKEEFQYLLRNDIGKFYPIIYILVPGGMYYFNLKTGVYKTFDIDSNRQCEHAIKARQMVIKDEEI